MYMVLSTHSPGDFFGCMLLRLTEIPTLWPSTISSLCVLKEVWYLLSVKAKLIVTGICELVYGDSGPTSQLFCACVSFCKTCKSLVMKSHI